VPHAHTPEAQVTVLRSSVVILPCFVVVFFSILHFSLKCGGGGGGGVPQSPHVATHHGVLVKGK